MCNSCCEKSEQSPYIVIDLAGNINKTTTPSTLNDYFDITQIIQLETSENFLLSDITFVGTNDNELILNDKNAVYFIDKKSGKLLSKIDRKGNGPGEYIQIYSTNTDKDGNIIVLDPSKKILLKYTRNGDFITSI